MVSKGFFLDLMTFLTHVNIRFSEIHIFMHNHTTTTKMEWSVILDTMDHHHYHTNYGRWGSSSTHGPGYGEQEAKPPATFTPWRAGPGPCWISSYLAAPRPGVPDERGEGTARSPAPTPSTTPPTCSTTIPPPVAPRTSCWAVQRGKARPSIGSHPRVSGFVWFWELYFCQTDS